MSRRVRCASWWVIGAVVIGVLTFGARAAFAESAGMDCPNDGLSYLGYQPNTEACIEACLAVHGFDLIDAYLFGQNCCRCIY